MKAGSIVRSPVLFKGCSTEFVEESFKLKKHLRKTTNCKLNAQKRLSLCNSLFFACVLNLQNREEIVGYFFWRDVEYRYDFSDFILREVTLGTQFLGE